MTAPVRTALVTGAARGIGRAIAARLAAGGMRVTACDVQAGPLEAAVAGLAAHGEVEPLVADVADHEAMAAWLAARSAPYDVLVNNAAVAPRIPLEELTPAELERVLRVNLEAAVFLAREAGRGMCAAGRGSIVNVASVNALRGQPDMLHYNASKAALVSATQTLALEYAPYGVRVNAVCPGSTWTEIWEEGGWGEADRERFTGRIPLRRFAAPEEIAAAVAFLAGDDASYVTGHALVVDGGLTVGM
ncbi:NAD(P)-dependent dehydrogenase (short-subunit alcohol dehydrogenase family) [Thermocatellispora tengchongensis]|uniref:NAD(P)-dependent dehydrogenase (Short-subunit alcohol dehydrogenase family) n=1 Tax=Thermocatellispora tengchongensis TaxID=1073253 RepID=A0A840P4W2_9ACTN|nr:SDR family oxidoreductase [Thermocatellispora tengchongensis]MBB5133556.1 NAD(P)-dependent dehydrogenase (short-subunit alcohol dehydrogenase family) [Thermocatellispora tengchongensis]